MKNLCLKTLLFAFLIIPINVGIDPPNPPQALSENAPNWAYILEQKRKLFAEESPKHRKAKDEIYRDLVSILENDLVISLKKYLYIGNIFLVEKLGYHIELLMENRYKNLSTKLTSHKKLCNESTSLRNRNNTLRAKLKEIISGRHIEDDFIIIDGTSEVKPMQVIASPIKNRNQQAAMDFAILLQSNNNETRNTHAAITKLLVIGLLLPPNPEWQQLSSVELLEILRKRVKVILSDGDNVDVSILKAELENARQYLENGIALEKKEASRLQKSLEKENTPLTQDTSLNKEKDSAISSSSFNDWIHVQVDMVLTT